MKRLVAIFLLFFGFNSIFAQTLENYNIEDGLSQSTINCIYQTKDGIMWFGTQDGLNAFDGYKFMNFRRIPNNDNSLSSNYINDITEDDNENLIIATRGGITIWNRHTGTFKHLITSEDNEKINIRDKDILQVKYKNGIIWALSSQELFKIQGNNIQKFQFREQSSEVSNSLTSENLYALTIDNNNNVWIGTTEGIFVFYDNSDLFMHLYNSPDKPDNIITTFFDNGNTLAVGTAHGLRFISKELGQVTKTYFYLNDSAFNENNFVKSIYIDTTVKLVGTAGGLKILKNNFYTDIKDSILSRIKGEIISIFKDKTGNIWIGTRVNGIYKINFRKKEFNPYYDLNKTLNHMAVFAITKDKKGKLWIGGSKLQIFDKNLKHIKDINFNTTPSLKTILSLLEYKDVMLVGTNNGVKIIDIQNFNRKNFDNYFHIKSKELNETQVMRIFLDKDSSLWFATISGLFKIKNNKITAYKNDKTNPKSISSNIIMKIAPFHDSLFALATYNGLDIFNKYTGEKIKNFSTLNSFPSDVITDVYIQNDSIIWATTTTGLVRLNYDTENLKIFTIETTGFKNDFFYAVLPYREENFLLPSNFGVVKFNWKTYTFYTFEKKDGLPFYEFNTGAYFQDSTEIILGGIHGITSIKFNKEKYCPKPPPIVITKIEILTSSQKNKVIYFPKIDSIYEFNNNDIVTIFFTIPDYSCDNNNTYQFKIININPYYSNLSTNNRINLTGLKGGDYTLEIKGYNCFQQISDPVFFKFHIKPPFSQSIWARIIGITIIIIILSLIFLIIYMKIKNKNKILEAQKEAYQKINEQNKLLEERAESLKDSLNYASKIIAAMLPNKENLKEIIPQSFIFFKPKDIVSGDFYWFKEKNNYFYITAVDCTGHGIPGAFMSIIGMNLLERFVNDGYTDPAVILNMMNKHVIQSLKKQLDQKHLKDGMDMALCIIDKQHKTLKFAGAYNPAYIIRNNKLMQLKGDRKTVGTVFDFNSFSSMNIKIQNDDFVFLFTDGYTDQFGGPEHKKFKFKRFRELLLNIHQLPGEEQVKQLEETLEKWKGDFEQIDDILIIGFKPAMIFENL